MCKTTAITMFASAVLATSSIASAQHWGGGPSPRDGACFYKDANYRGQYFCIRAGDDAESLPSGASDEVSSIRVFGRAEVTVYKDSRFRGDSRQFDSDVRDLQGEHFNDTISSIQVQGRRSSGRRDRPSFGGERSPELIVRRAYQDILDRDPDPVGMRTYRSRIIDDGWTEEQVRDALRRSPEYREKNMMTRAKAEEIVRRAYLAVLNREPDEASRGYVNNVLRDRWTQQDVERELRRSPEYRNRGR